MQSICYNGGGRHYHTSVDQVRECYAATRRVAPESEHLTTRQRDYIVRLGGDPKAADLMTKRVASRYIDALRATVATVASATHSVPAPGPGRPSASVPTMAPSPRPASISTPVTTIPLPLLEVLPAGHFAVRSDANEPYTFLRIRKPKNGRFTGCTIIQTRHGDRFITRFALFPNGKTWIWTTVRHHVAFLENAMMLVLADYQYAMMTYGREIGKCMICGKTLTDERSRWYGIGPDCETRYPFPVDRLDEEFGPWFLGKVRD